MNLDATMPTNIIPDIYACEASGQDRLASQLLMSYLESEIRADHFDSIEFFFDMIDIEHLSSKSLCGLVRCTWRVNEFLTSWDSIYKRSWNRVKALGKDPERIFVGLPKIVQQD